MRDVAIMEKLIRQEADWCKANCGTSNEGSDFEAGFITGLEQTLYLLEAAKLATELDHMLVTTWGTGRETANSKEVAEATA
jgi:hypothetical protein